MPWIYHQATGEIDHDGKKVGTGYAGRGIWKNKPRCQSLKDEGPLPQGQYAIAGHFTDDPTTGRHSLRLTPNPHNHMFGRSHFLIHGPNPAHPTESSDGCIVTSLPLRMRILRSHDRVLEVVP